MAPQVGLEPTTLRLTAGCSANRSLILKGIRAALRHDNCSSFGVLLDNLLDNFLARPDPSIAPDLQVISQSRLVDAALSRAIPNISSDVTARKSSRQRSESISTKFRFIRGVSTHAAFAPGALSSQKIRPS